MAGLNNCQFIGRTGREVEIRFTKSEKKVANVSIAIQERKNDPTIWINIIAWEKLADIFADYVKKGDMIYVSGRLQFREWEDKDGVKRQTTEIVASNMTMLGQVGNQNNQVNQGSQSSGPDDFEDSDVPF
jgi:single-strand DNA-binding protein